MRIGNLNNSLMANDESTVLIYVAIYQETEIY